MKPEEEAIEISESSRVLCRNLITPCRVLTHLFRHFRGASFTVGVLALKMCMLSCSFVSNSLQAHGQQPARLLCPWDLPGKNTGVGCHFLLKGTFLTQVLKPTGLMSPALKADPLPLCPLGGAGLKIPSLSLFLPLLILLHGPHLD